MRVPSRCLVGIALVVLISLPAHAQTLVEAAAAAKAARATGMGWPTSANNAPTAEAAAATLKTAPLPSIGDLTPITSTNDTKTEAYWRGRLRPLAEQLTTDLRAVASLSVRYDELRTRFNGMTTVFQQQLVAPEMFRIQTELRTAQDAVDSDTRAIDDLKEEGRRASARPGWFR